MALLWESDLHGLVADLEACLLLRMISTIVSAAALWVLEGTYNAVQEGLQLVLIPLMSFSSEWPVGSSAQDVGVRSLEAIRSIFI